MRKFQMICLRNLFPAKYACFALERRIGILNIYKYTTYFVVGYLEFE